MINENGESCGHADHEDCMYCILCGSGCREDLNDDDVCPECKYPGMDNIHMSLVNGQYTQFYEQVREYGAFDFFDYYYAWLDENIMNKKKQREYFHRATVHYIYHREVINAEIS